MKQPQVVGRRVEADARWWWQIDRSVQTWGWETPACHLSPPVFWNDNCLSSISRLKILTPECFQPSGFKMRTPQIRGVINMRMTAVYSAWDFSLLL